MAPNADGMSFTAIHRKYRPSSLIPTCSPSVVLKLLPLFSYNAAVSRNLCAVCLVVQWNDSDTTRQTARKLSVCTALLDAFSLYLLPLHLNYGRSKRPILIFNIPRYPNEANQRRIQESMGSIRFTETLELERLICS